MIGTIRRTGLRRPKVGSGRLKAGPAIVAAAAAAAAWAAAAQAEAGLRLIVTHAVPPLVPNSVMDLAEALGAYRKAGLDIEIVRVQQTPSAIAALRSGAGDMANISTSAALQLVARDQMRLRAVISPNKAIPFLIAARRSVAAPRALEGRTFGVGRVGSLDDTLSRLVLGAGGVDTGRIRMVAIGQPRVRAQALVGGRVDATTMSIGVWTSIKDKSGVHVIVPQAAYFEAAPLLSKVNVVTAETLARKRADIRKFVRAIIELSRTFARDPDSWAAAMARVRPEIARAKLDQLARAYAKSWSVNGGLNLAQVAYTTRRQYFRKDFKGLRRVDPAEWVVVDLIDEVLAEIGVDPGSDATGR